MTIPKDLQQAVKEVIEDGYSIIGNCLSDDACDALSAYFDDRSYGQRELLKLEAVQRLASSSTVQNIATACLGDKAFAVSGTYFNKTPSANWKVPWHQDRMIKVEQRFDLNGWGPWSVKEGILHVQPPALVMSRIIAIRLHLDPCPKENGALRVISRSHRDGYLDAEKAKALLLQTEVICEVPKGGALLMSPLLVHSSLPAKSASARRVIHLEFTAYELPEPLQWRYRVA